MNVDLLSRDGISIFPDCYNFILCLEHFLSTHSHTHIQTHMGNGMIFGNLNVLLMWNFHWFMNVNLHTKINKNAAKISEIFEFSIGRMSSFQALIEQCPILVYFNLKIHTFGLHVKLGTIISVKLPFLSLNSTKIQTIFPRCSCKCVRVQQSIVMWSIIISSNKTYYTKYFISFFFFFFPFV